MTKINYAYRKRPVVIEAFQMTPVRRYNNSEWPDWLREAWELPHDSPGSFHPADPDYDLMGPYAGGLEIETLEGSHSVQWGDWIIRGVQGELYPCKPDIFAATYIPATGTPPEADPDVTTGYPAKADGIWMCLSAQYLTKHYGQVCEPDPDVTAFAEDEGFTRATRFCYRSNPGKKLDAFWPMAYASPAYWPEWVYDVLRRSDGTPGSMSLSRSTRSPFPSPVVVTPFGEREVGCDDWVVRDDDGALFVLSSDEFFEKYRMQT